ncbi:hypothetical protein BMF77_00293 [Dolichospermum sp. UHCC 0315A]|uniref:DUF1308 domain-containing protein n=1 Tax=Dolichospermum sp. UHCC 0315A TaxID=1914871 RepID=UPI0012556647|nr:DUF1308 domain-containing protein [Dolichospermum sp. UHCC 0315A]QEI39740.1 hypothetical protein BMF77_00293 [Dolichospermum sp. UHCC 0315A]
MRSLLVNGGMSAITLSYMMVEECDSEALRKNRFFFTTTADAKAVRAASAQGVDFHVYIHPPFPLIGN